jgi:hypothetical protein
VKTTGPWFLLLATCMVTSWSAAQEEPTVLGKPSSIQTVAEPEKTVLVPAGARLRERPGSRAPVLETFTSVIELPVLDEEGSWIQVRFGAWLGWVRIRGEQPDDTVDPGPHPDQERLERALGLFDHAVDPGALGPYRLYTDVTDARLLTRLSAAASDVERAYRERYALDPGSSAGTIVVLYAQEEAYREFEAAETRIAAADSQGHTSEDLSILYTGGQPTDAILAVLIHELTHLLGRRVFTDAIPPWLDEGMAQDLAFSRLNRQGRIRLGTLSTVETDLDTLVKVWNSPAHPGLAGLTSLDWSEFIEPVGRPLRYAESAFLIRYLLDSGEEGLREGFLRYLAELAEAELSESVSLFVALEREPDKLERGFYRFLVSQVRAHGIS